MQDEAGMASQPLPHLRVPVGAVVVQDQLQRLARRGLPVQPLEEAKELLMPVPLVGFPNYLSFGDLECGKQGGRSVALVVVGEGSTTASLQGQPRLGAIQGLNLALFFDARDDRVLWGRQIDPDHVGELLDEALVPRQLEAAHLVRLELMVVPDSMDRALADSLGLGHRTSTPLGCPLGLVLEGRFDESSNPRLSVSRLPSTAGCDVPHRSNALPCHAVAPQPHGGALDIQILGDAKDRFATAGAQGDSASQGNLLRSGTGGSPLFEAPNLRGFKDQDRRDVGHSAKLDSPHGWIANCGALYWMADGLSATPTTLQS